MRAVVVWLSLCLPWVAQAQQRLSDIPEYTPPPPVELSAEPLQRFPAAEALQGVAVDDRHFYAVVNFAIGKYDRSTGERVGGWIGPRRGLIGHLNSCYADAGKLWCANSNHPEVPMASSVEIFETATMTHADSKSLGLMDEGSLTWFVPWNGGWVAGFAHYNDETGEPFKSNAYAGVHTFDAEWRRTGGWRLPSSLIEPFSPAPAGR